MLEVLFYLLDGSEDFVHHLGDDGVAVCAEGFSFPFCLRNGKVVQREGKPIISSVNRGDSREKSPSFRRPASLIILYTLIGTSSCLPSFIRFSHASTDNSAVLYIEVAGVGRRS